MSSSGMLRRVALVSTDVSVECSVSTIRVTTIDELGTRMEKLRSSGTFIIATATRRNIPDDATIHSHRCENLKSCTRIFIFTAVKTSNLT
jgi:hypothetical protein